MLCRQASDLSGFASAATKIFPAKEAFFLRDRDKLPDGRIKADDLGWTIAFQEHAALDLNLESARTGNIRNLLSAQHVSTLAIIGGVVGHQCFASDGDRALRCVVILSSTTRGPTKRLWIDPTQILATELL
mgnify:CR=1 FL=1